MGARVTPPDVVPAGVGSKSAYLNYVSQHIRGIPNTLIGDVNIVNMNLCSINKKSRPCDRVIEKWK